ncbi:CG2145 [Drosophila busckii]|uniref:CG2145 n=1 Tax=Drosophila busckii TaxID=30019 RepID=A0A0M3QZI8_DROBS|nr:poly(U)-specific endoribonuclease homolog [Drosophila busckii]ALC49493.1 CG2145 [Drosophila busckii]
MRCLALSALFVCVVIAGQCEIAAGYKSEIEITPAPDVETTTKKSGWFGGFKKFFGSSSSETTTTTSTTTTTTTRRPVAATPTAAQKPPPLVISHAPLQPLGPRPDTPSSSPFGATPAHGPQWPAAAAGAGGATAQHNIGSSSTTAATAQHGRPQLGPSTAANLPPGFAPYRPQKPQPSGFDLSYSGGGAGHGAGAGMRPGSGLAPLTSSTSTTTTTTQRPKMNMPGQPQPMPGGIDLRFGGSTSTSTVKPPQHGKEQFPSLPGPRSPSIKEDYPALPTPRTPGSTPSTPNSPSAWQSPLPTPVVHPAVPAVKPTMPTATTPKSGSGVSFVPHTESSTTVRPGFTSTGNSVATDDEIRQLTEQLYTKESNNQISQITVNLQGRTRSIDSGDEAPQPLLTVSSKALEAPTIAKMRVLFNNYEQDTLVNEHVTANERKEENEFVDAVMATSVMRQAMLFLQQKGIVTADPKTHRDLVKELWFTQYSRGQGKIGSSGFEHVFVHEVKNGTIIGFHNWVYMAEEEQAGRLDYKGYMKEQDIGTKAKVVKLRFTHQGLNKPVNSVFVGTSPELELALYTVCFQLRPDRTCPVSLGNSKFGIITYSWRYRGKSLIGSAFPEI